jgi:hypothetical protein
MCRDMLDTYERWPAWDGVPGRRVLRQDRVVASIPALQKRMDHFHVRLRHHLPPFLGEPFGACAGLVDVYEDDRAYDLPGAPLVTPMNGI